MTVASMLAHRVERANLGSQADRVVQILLQMPQFASYASARELAERAGANVSTVVRTAQQLEFNGWTEMRETLRAEYLNSLVTATAERPISSDAAAKMLRQDATNLAAVSSSDNTAAIQDVARAMKRARRTVVLTTGSGAGPAHILHYLASIYGYDVELAVGPATAQAVVVSRMDERDCLVVLNVWRLTRALRGLTSLGGRQGATIAVLTDLHSSPLNADADHVVITPIEGVGVAPSLTAMVSVVHAILAELEESASVSSVGRIEQAWHELGLMDDQP